MRRFDVVGVAVIVLGGIAAVTAAAVLVMTALSSAHAASVQFGRGGGWAIPLLAGGAIGVFAWLMLSEVSPKNRGFERATARCTMCGSEVLDGWRMCPYCGEPRADDAEQSSETAPTA